ncbi:Tyrocidine synthase 3 [Kordia antarctica]|uniref:Tyrocidine synthase 3 n=1 Tax=Kordia antarctica TaxID=1218801 RepID=A0A7L4ZGR7_9FLAO|nr:non-ribosomal peptide synthetase [Kordia antarctica]QHI35446.1 Tyrocidine synthase 3 [Kordia antarctica]
MPQSVKEILSVLRENEIKLTLDQDNLRVTSHKEKLPEAILSLLKSSKTALINYLKSIELANAMEQNKIPKATNSENYLLSSPQNAVWLASQLETSSIAYNIPQTFAIIGDVDITNFEKAIHNVIERHEILRTAFKENEEGEIRQWILSVEELDLKITTHNYINVENQEAAIRNYITTDLQQPFNLEEAPAFRCSLLQLEKEHYLFYCNMHHIISDEWSIKVLADEVIAYYQAFKEGIEIKLDNLSIQYKDYATWQQNQLDTAQNQISKDYWTERLSGTLPVINFPSKTTRPLIKTFDAEKIVTNLGASLTSNLRTYSIENGGSVFMSLLSGLNVILQRYTLQKDIIIGAPVTGRNHSDLENQIGFYVNLLPLRNHIKEEASFNQVFSKIKQTTLEAFTHQQYPFESIVKNTQSKRRDSSRSPLFDVLMDYHNNENPIALLTPEESGTIKILGKGLVKFDIEFHITDLVDDLEIQMNYNTDLYESELMHQFLGDYKKMVSKLIQSPNDEIRTVALVEDEALSTHTTESEASLQNLVEMFQKQAKEKPKAVALVAQNKEITYSELDELSNKLASSLRQNYAIEENDLVGIYLDRSDEMVIAMLGILKTGAAYIPIDTNYPIARVQDILDDAAPKLLITETNYMFELPEYDGNVFAIDVEFDPEEFENTHVASTSKNNVAYVLYTSGSTGKPKGVMISNTALANYLTWGKSYYIKDQKYTGDFGLFTSISFDLTVTSLFLPLVSGHTLHILASENNIGVTLQNYFSKNIPCIKLTPAHINLLEGIEIQNTNIQLVIVGGDRLHKYQVEIAQKIFPSARIINEYGPTEATVGCSVYEIRGNEETIFIGKPILNTDIHIVNSAGMIQPKGVMGELCISGLGIAEGYINNEKLTAEKFKESIFGQKKRIYKTGDLGRWSFDEELEYIGRNDEQVKISGYRIELGEINELISTHPSIETSTVLCRENSLGEKILVAYIKTTQEVKTEALKSYVGKKLPAYTIPNIYLELDEFPLTSNGKIDKEKLVQIDFEEANKTSYVAPENAAEEQLISLWEKHLQKEDIGITDNFFSLGGDSIRAIQLVIEIKKIFGSDLSVADIFEKQTIQELVPVIEDKRGGNTVQEYLKTGHQEIQKFEKGIEKENKRIKIISDEYEEIYPLTPIEVGMIFSSLIRNEEPVYYDQYSYTLIIENEAEFEKNITKLANRHASLRTKYYTKSFSQPTKVVYTTPKVPLIIEDLRMVPDEEKRSKILDYSEADLNLRLDFNDDLLWRVKAFRISDNLYSIFFSFHHALLDGWSTSIFKTELSNITHTDLKPLKSTYKDYCAITIGRKKLEGVEGFWKEMLDGYTRNKLPFNTNRKRLNDETGMSIISRWLPAQLMTEITKLSEELKVSVKTICLAAHAYLLKVVCSETEIVTGVVTHERPEIEDGLNIMGCFLNTVPIRLNIAECSNVTSLITMVNEHLIKMKSKEIHLAEIAQIIGEKSTLNNPIFDTLMNYTDFHQFENWNEESEVNQTHNELFDHTIQNHEMTNTLFDLEVDKTLNNLTVAIKYANTYFNKEDMIKAAELYEMILQSFVDNPTMQCEDILLLTAEDTSLIDAFNQTKEAYESNSKIHELFERKAAILPEAIALKHNINELDYKSLNEQANQVAHYLREKGLNTGDHVGIIASRNFSMIIGLLGILKAGGVYIPIDPIYPAERKSYLIENSHVSWLLIDDIQNDFDAENITKIFLNEDTISDCATNNLGIEIDSNQLAYTIYTSGSTGRPKGVMIPHHAAVNLVEWVNETYNINEDDNLLFVTSMCFDLSVYDIFGMLAAGGSIVIVSQEEITNFSVLKEIIKKEKITFWDSVPTTMNYLVAELEYENTDFLQEELKLVFMSGDWIPTQLPDKIRKFFPNANVISLGGATEGTVWSNYYPIKEVDPTWSSIPYGKPIKNNFFYILDDHLNKVPVGTSGELFIGGVGVARGYANDSVKTNASFVPDPFDKELGGMMYKTGDIGRMMPDGNMEFLGRKDYQVKIRGFRVELGEIESVVRKNEHVKEAIVSLLKNDADVQQLVVYVVQETPITFEEIRLYIRDYLPEYMIPEYCVFLEALPLNSNGKIDRKQLPKPDISEASSNQEGYVHPQTELEIKLSDILKSILNSEVSTDANFFELGIDSLTVGALVNRIVNKIEVNIGIRDVFNNPTIAELASEIEKINWASQEDTKESNNTEKISI